MRPFPRLPVLPREDVEFRGWGHRASHTASQGPNGAPSHCLCVEEIWPWERGGGRGDLPQARQAEDRLGHSRAEEGAGGHQVASPGPPHTLLLEEMFPVVATKSAGSGASKARFAQLESGSNRSHVLGF